MGRSNVTKAFRKLLDERDTEYGSNGEETLVRLDGKTYRIWAYDNERLAMSIAYLTPKQAIAATLGRPKAMSSQEAIVRSFLRKISPNRDWDYLGEHEHAMIADLVDDIAATLGAGPSTDVTDALELLDEIRSGDRIGYNDYSRLFDAIATLGVPTLTAEQVREVIERHVKFYEGGDYDEQVIADELNAELGKAVKR